MKKLALKYADEKHATIKVFHFYLVKELRRLRPHILNIYIFLFYFYISEEYAAFCLGFRFIQNT